MDDKALISFVKNSNSLWAIDLDNFSKVIRNFDIVLFALHFSPFLCFTRPTDMKK